MVLPVHAYTLSIIVVYIANLSHYGILLAYSLQAGSHLSVWYIMFHVCPSYYSVCGLASGLLGFGDTPSFMMGLLVGHPMGLMELVLLKAKRKLGQLWLFIEVRLKHESLIGWIRLNQLVIKVNVDGSVKSQSSDMIILNLNSGWKHPKGMVHWLILGFVWRIFLLHNFGQFFTGMNLYWDLGK